MPGGRVIDYADLTSSNNKVWVEVSGPMSRLTVVLEKCDLNIGDIVYWELLNAWVIPQEKVSEIEEMEPGSGEWDTENEYLESLSDEEVAENSAKYRLSIPRYYLQGMTFKQANEEIPKYEKFMSGKARAAELDKTLEPPGFVTECIDSNEDCHKCIEGIKVATALALQGATVHAVMHHNDGVFVLCEDQGYEAIEILRDRILSDQKLGVPDYVKILEPLDDNSDEDGYEFDI